MKPGLAAPSDLSVRERLEALEHEIHFACDYVLDRDLIRCIHFTEDAIAPNSDVRFARIFLATETFFLPLNRTERADFFRLVDEHLPPRMAVGGSSAAMRDRGKLTPDRLRSTLARYTRNTGENGWMLEDSLHTFSKDLCDFDWGEISDSELVDVVKVFEREATEVPFCLAAVTQLARWGRFEKAEMLLRWLRVRQPIWMELARLTLLACARPGVEDLMSSTTPFTDAARDFHSPTSQDRVFLSYILSMWPSELVPEFCSRVADTISPAPLTFALRQAGLEPPLSVSSIASSKLVRVRRKAPKLRGSFSPFPKRIQFRPFLVSVGRIISDKDIRQWAFKIQSEAETFLEEVRKAYPEEQIGKSLTKVKDLTPRSRQVDILAKVISIDDSPQSQRKYDTPLKVAKAVIGDETACIPLWFPLEQIGMISIDDSVLVHNGYIATKDGKTRLQVGRSGELIKPSDVAQRARATSHVSSGARNHASALRPKNDEASVDRREKRE